MSEKGAGAAAVQEDVEEELDIALLEKYDYKIRRRMYLKKMRRIYREEERQERAYLANKVLELESVLAPMLERARSSAWMLPWKDVAMELKDESNRSLLCREDLAAQIHEYEQLVRRMSKWVVANTALKCSLDGRVSTWRDSSLLANPRSRQVGKEWIMNHLYHNSERMFCKYGFPPLESAQDFYLFDMQISDTTMHGVEYVLGGQFDTEFQMDTSAQLFCHHSCSVLMANFQHPAPLHTAKEIANDTVLHQMVTANGEFVNVLCKHFVEGNRFVAVMQDIIDDETVPEEDRQRVRRYRTYWTEITCLPSGQWKRRFLYLMSQRCSPLGPASLEEEALIWGCYLSEVAPELRQARFRHQFMTMCARLCAKGGFFHPETAVNRGTRANRNNANV